MVLPARRALPTGSAAPDPARVLLLDNRDSFVWNLAHALAACGAAVDVRRSDRTSLEQVLDADADALVLSPGPGTPADAFVCIDAVRALSGRVPVLGVCLGHQVIGAAFGGCVDRVEPCHGVDCDVLHDGHGPFLGLPSPLRAARYHSLAVLGEPWSDQLLATAHTADGVVMAIRHRHHPHTWGVQFHPESFLTPDGRRMLTNFLATVPAAELRVTRPVEVHGLRRSFGSKVALASVDLHVGPGEIVGFVGPNGAGKSTCLRALVGLIRPDGGSARVFGLDAVGDSLTVRRQVSYLPGETSVYAHLRGDDFLAFALHFYPGHDAELLRELRERWPLPWRRRVRTYSAGMKQKLALMACLVPDIGLYLLDEPDRALDATARLFLREVLAGLRNRGKSVLLSSHHLADVEAIADRLVFVIEGRTVAEDHVEATRAELRQWLRLRLRGDGELPDGALAVERETDGSLRVRVDGDPLQFLQRIDRQRIETVEIGVTRLEDLYRALARTEEVAT